MIKQHNFNFPLNSSCTFPSIHECQNNIYFYNLQIFVDLPHISSTKLIFIQALHIQCLHSFLMNLAKIPVFRLVLALPRYWQLRSAIQTSGCLWKWMWNCLNMSEFASDFESTWIQSLLFIQVYSETQILIFPLVLLCPSLLAVKYPE